MMTFSQIDPWKLTTDQYFGVDTATVCHPDNLKKDYAGEMVFMNVPKHVKEQLLDANFEDVRWVDIIGYEDGMTALYAEKVCANARKKSDEETIFFKIPKNTPLLNVASKQYPDFIKWSGSPSCTPENDKSFATKLQEYGNFEGFVDRQGKATVLHLNNKYLPRGQIYPIERKTLVSNALEKGCDVSMLVKEQVFEDEYSDILEDEYLNPSNEYDITWNISLTADNAEDAASKALENIRDPEFVAPLTFSVNNSMTGESVDIDLDDLNLNLNLSSGSDLRM